MIIYKPVKLIKEDEVIIKAAYTMKNKNDELWFSISREYEQYLVTENADAFLVGLLLLAMKNGEDIEVQAPISAKLYYQLNHYVINALHLANGDWKKINIKTNEINDKDLCFKSVAGTGGSCGVDSFATVYDHLDELDIFKVNFFTFFNAGSHGQFGGEKAREVFKGRVALVKPYVDKVKKSILEIDTNINEVLMMDHEQTYAIRNVACVLNLQKLFKYYYHASSYRFDDFKLNNCSMGHYEMFLLCMLSTESTTFYSTVSQYTRVERTKNITCYPPTYKNLNVCVASEATGEVLNCSICPKCLRTELTLDLLGKLDLYKDVFDLNKYKNKREKYIGEILSGKNSDIYSKEIYLLIKSKNYHISLKSYFFYFAFSTKECIIKILQIFSKKYEVEKKILNE